MFCHLAAEFHFTGSLMSFIYYVFVWTEHSEAKYRQTFVVMYTGAVVVKDDKELYVNELETQLPGVETDLQEVCNSNILKPPTVHLSKTFTFKVTGGAVCIINYY